MFPTAKNLRRTLVAIGMACGVAAASGATSTWVGNTSSGNWNATTNWTLNGIPAAAATAAFSSASTFGPNLNVNSTIGELLFSGSYSTTFTGTSTLTVGTGGIADTSTGAVTFNNPMATSGAETWSTGNVTGTLTFNSNLALGGTLTLAPNSAKITIGGSITGANALTVNGSGTALLTGANTYTGTTTITTGTLQVGNGGAGGSITSNVADSSHLVYDVTGATTYNGIVSGTGSLANIGSGTLVLTGANTYSGGTTITAGGLQIGAGGAVGSIGGNVTDNGTLTFDRSNALTYAGIISGTGGLTQAGSSTLTLTGASTYSGATTVSTGTLSFGVANAVGTTSAVTVASGATLALNNNAGTVGSLGGAGNVFLGSAALTEGNANSTTTFSGTIYGTGALTQSGTGTLVLSGANTYSGGTTISTGGLQIGAGGTTGSIAGNVTDNAALTYDLSSSATYAGIISGTGSLTQAGSATLTLAGASTYTGATTVSGGTLAFGVANAIGTTSAVTVGLGATLALNNNAGTVGSLGGAGNVTLGSAALTEGNANSTTTFSGTVSGTGALTKNGSGTLVLSGSNTYSGGTTISAGGLQIGAGGTTGSIAGNVTDNAALIYNESSLSTFSGIVSGTGALVQAGSGTLVLSGGSTYSGGTTISAGALQIGAGGTTGSILNNVTDNGVLIYNQSDANTFSGVVSGSGAVVQAGSGTTVITGTNTYSGGTTITSGALIVGNASGLGSSSGAVNVASGGTLGLSGGINITGQTGTLTLSGTGAAGSSGALANVSGNNSYEGPIGLAGNATISSGANLLYVGVGNNVSTNTIFLGGNTLTLNTTSASGAVTPTYETGGNAFDATNMMINSTITGSGGITKSGGGIATIYQAGSQNNFTGTTLVTGGTLIVDAGSSNQSIIPSTNVIVGNAVSPGTQDSVILQQGELSNTPAPNELIGTYTGASLVSATNLTIYQDGEYNMNNGSNGFAGITLQGGTIDQGSLLYSPGLAVGAGGITTNADSQTALIKDGDVIMSNSSFTYNIASGSTPSGHDLQIDSIVQNGVGYTQSVSADGLIKTGLGTMVLTNDNTYQGITDVQQGVLNIQNNMALGQNGGTFGSTNNGTVVESGAALQLQNNIQIANETITLNGSGVGSTGAMLNVSGSNTDNGFVYLGSNSRIDSNAGSSLTLANTASGLSGNIMNGTSPGENLTVGGGGTVVVNGAISSNVGNIGRDGTGTLILAGPDSYTGATTVTAGVLEVTGNSSLSGSGAIVSSGASLEFAQNATGGNVNEDTVAATISGTGVSNNGAIDSISGTNSYGGNITLAAAARIDAESGSVLTMTGTVTGSGQNLTVGGSGATNFVGIIGTGTGTVTKDGTGTATYSNAMTYTGNTTVSNGVLAFAGNNALGTTNTINIASTGTITTNSAGVVQNPGSATYGTLSLGNNTDTVSMITGAGLVSFGTSNTNSQLTLVGTGTFSGAFNGTGTLILAAGSSLTLGNNFNDPNLNIVLDGGTLNVAGTNSIFGTLVVEANSTLNFSKTLTSVIEFNGSVNNINSSGDEGGVYIYPGVTLSVANWVNTVDFFDSATEPNDSGSMGRFYSPLNQIVFDSPTWAGSNTTWNNYADGPGGDPGYQITPVPEPSFYGAIAVALAMAASLAYALRRRLYRRSLLLSAKS